MLGQCTIDVLQRHAGGHVDARQRGEPLRRDLVERKVRGGGAGPCKRNAAQFAHRLQFAVLGAAAVKAEHQQALLGFRRIERPFKRHTCAAGDELVLERPRVTEQRLGAHTIDIVAHIPEPQLRIRQRAMQRLRARHRDQTFLVAAAKKDRDAHKPIPIRSA